MSRVLYILKHLSAVPRKFFRDYENSSDSRIIDEFKNHLIDFINANNQTIKAKKVLIDFHVVTSQPVPQQYIDATIEVFKARADCSNIEELAIVRV
ncbi:MAG: hypothetical protein N5P05_004418 (plasmid) [Chroococcopsis gigantea SAG 12.99]|nr:hypothetical protein [Chroococcopsis gigantea SAG 12.99]